MTTKITEQNISELANAGVNWQSVFTGDGSTGLTAVAGRGYFIDTTSGTVTVTLPASPSAGDVVVLKDYARTWNTNNVTTASALVDGATGTTTYSTEGQTVTLVYMDGTKGWSLINEDTTSSLVPAQFISATGGTVTTSGDYKIHTFTGDGCFVVSCGGNSLGSNKVSYVVVAGGGAGGKMRGGAGGAGGYREGKASAFDSYTASPLVAPDGLPVSAQTYPVTVGAGAATSCGSSSPTDVADPVGSNSVFSTITSTGGGKGGGSAGEGNAVTGGSGGGGIDGAGAAGNTPPVSPSQGNTGGIGISSGNYGSGGGGGAGGTGGDGTGPIGGVGGAGTTSCITGSPVTRAGGGGGSTYSGGSPGPAHPGGGGGGAGGANGGSGGANGSANTGGGGGGGYEPGPDSSQKGGAGGKGIVIIRYKFQ
jgi:hypothetical protein